MGWILSPTFTGDVGEGAPIQELLALPKVKQRELDFDPLTLTLRIPRPGEGQAMEQQVVALPDGDRGCPSA